MRSDSLGEQPAFSKIVATNPASSGAITNKDAPFMSCRNLSAFFSVLDNPCPSAAGWGHCFMDTEPGDRLMMVLLRDPRKILYLFRSQCHESARPVVP